MRGDDDQPPQREGAMIHKRSRGGDPDRLNGSEER
jgi:hypothetical protein